MCGFTYYELNNKPFFEVETSVCLDEKHLKKERNRAQC